jgi:hypothetical protein
MHNKLHIQLDLEIEPTVSLFTLIKDQKDRSLFTSENFKVNVGGVSIQGVNLTESSFSAMKALSEERAIEIVEKDRDSKREEYLSIINNAAEALRELS